MNVKQQRRCVAALCIGVAAVLAAPGAWAFYPIGAFDPFGTLRFQTWRFAHFDNNNDGQVTQGEGLGVYIEVGPLGFNQDEVQEILRGLQVWADVPTSYAQFRVLGLFQDRIDPLATDNLTTISLDFPEEGFFGTDNLLAGFTSVISTVTDTVISINGTTFNVSAGTILDADTIVNANVFRDLGAGGLDAIHPTTLAGAMVLQAGILLGLGEPPPLNGILDNFGRIVEEANFLLRNPQGELELVGLTSSMSLNPPLTIVDEASAPVDGYLTLAPSDIAAVSYLYPRGDRSNFFNFSQRARTQARVDLPSLPLPNALVTAWIDHDNNPNTPRLPFASTLTGMFENDLNDVRQDIFNILGLWKRIHVPGQPGQVDATYTFTISPLNGSGVERLAPPGWEIVSGSPIRANTIDGSTSEVFEQFLSETFNESGNIIDLSNRDEGTAMTYDSARGRFVSVETGRTIDQILPGSSPMFGDPIPICPFNIITGGDFGGGGGLGETGDVPTLPGVTLKSDDRDGGGGGAAALGTGGRGGPPSLPGTLRGFRDGALLKTAAGAAFVDWYYTVAPGISAWMLRSTTHMAIAKTVYQGMDFGVKWRLYLVLPLLALAWMLRGMPRRRPAMPAAALILVALALVASPAWAQLIPASTADLTELAERVVLVEVEAMESYEVQRPGGKRIQTDVSVRVLENAKGSASKATVFTFAIPSGQVGNLKARTVGLAEFRVGERAVLFLVPSREMGWHVLGGLQGKVPVFTAAKTGEEYVQAGHHVQAHALKTVAAQVAELKAKRGEPTRADEGKLSVAEFLDYIRALAWERP